MLVSFWQSLFADTLSTPAGRHLFERVCSTEVECAVASVTVGLDHSSPPSQSSLGGSRKGSKGNAVRGRKTSAMPRLPPQL